MIVESLREPGLFTRLFERHKAKLCFVLPCEFTEWYDLEASFHTMIYIEYRHCSRCWNRESRRT